MEKLLKLIEADARLSDRELAVMTGMTEAEVAAELRACREAGIIGGYRAIVNWDKTSREHVAALIEVKVTPQKDHGFDDIALRVARFPEVESAYLMSGAYDLAVIVTGRTFKDIATFVSHKLSPMERVVSTSTHFLLQRYKDHGALFEEEQRDERGAATL